MTKRPVGEVVAAAAEVEQRCTGGAARGVASTITWPARGHQKGARPAPGGTSWCAGRRPQRLEQVDELLTGRVVVAHPLEQRVQLGFHLRVDRCPTRRPPLRAGGPRRPASRPVSVSGSRASRASASAASPRSIEQCGPAPRWRPRGPARARAPGAGRPRRRRPPACRPRSGPGASLCTKAVTWASGRAPMNWSTTLPSLDGEDGRDRLHAEGLGDPRVVVDVDFGQLDGTVGGGHRLLEHRPERRAGAAPRGPEVDDDRHRRAAGQHIGLEGLVGDVHRPMTLMAAPSGRRPAWPAAGAPPGGRIRGAAERRGVRSGRHGTD